MYNDQYKIFIQNTYFSTALIPTQLLVEYLTGIMLITYSLLAHVTITLIL